MTIRPTAYLPLAPALVLCTTLASSAEPSPAAPAIEWRKNLGQALGLARQGGKPVVLDFWATWCPACKEMEAKFWSRPDVVEVSSKFICLKINVDDFPEVAQRYRAEALPTLVLSDPWGTEFARREGFGGPAEFLTLLKAMPGDFSGCGPLTEAFASNITALLA